MNFKKLALKLCVPFLFGLATLSAQAQAWDLKPGHAYPPYHLKSNIPTAFPAGLAPSLVKGAYGYGGTAAKGEGEVIAIVDAFDHPKIESDLGVFNEIFGLTNCTTNNGCFKKIYATGVKPPQNDRWAVEIALDVEWAHAAAPAAKIILVEAASDATVDLYNAVKVAVQSGATVVSMSWGSPEFGSESAFDNIFLNNPNVTFVTSSGDNGTGTQYPASSPYVLTVGGTSLSLDVFGNYSSEKAWSGSGGGVSLYEPWPTSQSGLPIPSSNGKRGVPDVSYNGDPSTGFSVYCTASSSSTLGWLISGGTSAGAPQWAGIVALANSSLKRRLGSNFINLIYKLAHPTTGKYSHDFHDITKGTNGGCGYYCTTQSGYDYVTGLGSPKVANLVQDLASALDNV
jgi:subtilase family serine protease